MIAQRDDVLLRHATEADLPAIDGLTTVAYAPIQESFVAMLGSDLYETVQADPGKTWDERKAAQNRRLFAEHPEQVWVLEDTGWVFGYVTFWLFPERSYGTPDGAISATDCPDHTASSAPLRIFQGGGTLMVAPLDRVQKDRGLLVLDCRVALAHRLIHSAAPRPDRAAPHARTGRAWRAAKG